MAISQTSTKLNFSVEEDDRLIEEIAKYPALYNMKDALYKDQRVKDNTWIIIADVVGRPVAECKKRWKNIKDTNDRKVRKTNRTGSEAPPSKKGKKEWTLQERLSFLKSADFKRRSFSNINEEEDANEPDDEFSLNDSVPQEEANISTLYPERRKQPATLDQVVQPGVIDNEPKRKIIHNKKTNYRENLCKAIEKRSKERDVMIKELMSKDEESDDLSLFFQSICKTVRKFPLELQQRSKLDTLTLVSNLQYEMFRNQESSAPVQSPTPSASSNSADGYVQPTNTFGEYTSSTPVPNSQRTQQTTMDLVLLTASTDFENPYSNTVQYKEF